MTIEADSFYMALALELAARGNGTTSPNPLVGAVLVKDGRIVGRGWHERAGAPHAEVAALTEAGDEARGATLYVTLEPCSHHGRTPPCADAVIRAGVRRVVAAMEDPNPLVAGSGLAKLAEAGIATDVGLHGEEARRQNEGFILSVVEKRSFVHLKLGATLDGKIATGGGESRWITSEESRETVHLLREQTGAVLVGVETALKDNPRLTARVPGKPERMTLRVILDRSLRGTTRISMLGAGEAASTLVICGERAPGDRFERFAATGARVERVPETEGGMLDLRKVLEFLYSMGRMEVLVEGGARTARAFLDQRLVDRIHFFYAPKILGGASSLSMIGGEGPERLSEAVKISDLLVYTVGPDVYVTGRPFWSV